MRRQTQIQQHHRGPLRLNSRDRRPPVLRQDDFVLVREPPLHLRADLFVIVGDQELRFHGFSIGNSKRKVVPLPGWLSTSIFPRCASTTILLRNSPTPIPFFFVV